ncbi:MAG TPA: Ig-like domain-containing protein [Thermoanaerobaculia bacterium]|nr:Ig-like domain-containing protein [Thermoanaerobaculia bacterium]
MITGGGTGLTYTPNANYCNSVSGVPDTFTYTLTPGGSSTTVTMTVTCADDNPVAVPDAATVTEDSGANPVPVLANDTDVDGGAISIQSVTQPANGAVVITGGGTGLTYAPNVNYCNSVSGVPDTFTYTLTPGGSTTTVTVTVTCVDDTPVAVNDAAVVAEDSGANPVPVLANDTDVDGGAISIQSVTQPANGTVVITGGGSGLTYQPNANYCNSVSGVPDTFTYMLAPGVSTATVSVTVTCLNDAPVLDLDANDSQGTGGSDFAVTFTEGEAAKLIEDPIDATVTDVDSANLASLTVTITNLLDTGSETLSADVTGTSITASYVPGTGVLTLTGPDTLANFQTVLRKVRYLNSDIDPDTTPRVIHFVANDGTANSNTAISTVTIVAVDTPPTAVADSATVAEDSTNNPINVLANDTDPDGGAQSIQSVTQPANGTVAITGGGTGVTYTPNANYCNSVSGTPDTFTYTLTPGGSTATVSVTVTCQDDNPVAVPDAATVLEDSGANAIPVLANDTDPDGGPISIQSVTQPANGAVVITGGGTGLTYAPNANYCNSVSGIPDTFTYTLTPGGSSTTVTVTVTCVDDSPVAVADAATVVEDSGANAINVLANDTDIDGGPISIAPVLPTPPANGTVVITGGGTGLTYTPNPNYCNSVSGVPDTFMYALSPGGSTATVTVTVTCVDDPPVAVADSATVVEDSGANAINVLANDTDPDGGPISITSVTQPTNGAVVITGGGTGLTYAPNLNYCNMPPGTTPDTFTYTLTPGGSSTTVSVLVTCVNDAPVLTNNPITYATAGNTQLHVAGATRPGVASISDPQSALQKSAPTDVDGPATATVVAASGASANGGSFTINTDGSFHYVPAAGFTGTDSFTYQVTDTVTPTTGTINIMVSQRVWYVRDVIDANNAAGGDGRSTNAFDSIAAFNAATTFDGDIIFIFRGNTGTTPLAGGITLRNGQKLHGEGIGLTVPGFGTLIPAGAKPRVNNGGGDAVSVPATAGNRQNVEIRGLDLQGSTNAVDVTASGANSVSITISDNDVRGAGLEGIDLNAGSTGTFAATLNNNSLAATGNAFDARTSAGSGTLTIDFSNQVVVSNATGILIDGSVGGGTRIIGFANNAVSLNNVGTGISITSATFDVTPGGSYQPVSGGTAVIGAPGLGNGVGGSGIVFSNVAGDLAFTDLDIFADGGTGLRITGTGAVNTGVGTGTRVTVGSGVAIFEATGGPAVDVTNATVDLQLTSIKSTNSPTTGISLTNVADGTATAIFSAGSDSSITNATGTDFNVDGGNATINYAGPINNTAGRSVSVVNRTADTVTVIGAITDTGAGIFLNSNTGSAIDFIGGLTLTTGASDALTATGGGTVRVTGAANTITTTTGIALNMQNTTIGNGSGAPETGLRFRSLSAGTAASGPSSGIVLNNTGASGSLTVTGTGGAGTGGTIQRTAGDGVSLAATLSPSFTSMSIKDTAGSGVQGTQVTNFTFVNGSIDNSGTALGADDSNIAFNTGAAGTERNLSGTVTITGNTLTNAYYHGVDILNFNGTLNDLTVSGNTVTSATTTASSKGSGIRLQALGSATTAANITKATLSNNVISRFPSGSGILMNCGNASTTGTGGSCGTPGSGANIVTVSGNAIAGQASPNQMGSNAIAVALTGGNGGSRSQGNFNISGNGTPGSPLTNFKGSGVACSVFGMSTATCSVTNNVMVANNIVASRCIAVGVDRTIGAGDTPDLTATISNNQISACDGNGIFTGALNSNGTARLKIQNNIVAAPLTGVRPGIRIDSGTPAAAGTNTTVCLNISGNTSAGSGGTQGIGMRKEGAVATTNAFGINGMVATSSPGVEAYVDGLNPAGNGTLLISATSGFSNCSLP